MVRQNGQHFNHNAPIQLILDRLRSVKKTKNGWRACCPAHDDAHPSLDISVGDTGCVLLKCWSAGCTVESIVSAIGLQMSDLFEAPATAKKAVAKGKGNLGPIVATYDYTDAAGKLLYQVLRYEPPGDEKTFLQRRPNGQGGFAWGINGQARVPYMLPDLLAAPADAWVYVPEGEKDVEALAEQGLTATTNAGGALNWATMDDAAVRQAFAGRRVVILPDNDDKGRRHAQDVAKRLSGIAAEVRIVKLPGLAKKGDVYDWLKAGGTIEELMKLVEAAAPWTGEPAADDEEEPKGPALVLLRGTDLKALSVEWLWGSRIPRGAVTLIDGDPGLGKSTITLDLAARVTRGWTMPPTVGDKQVAEPAAVLLLSAEDDPDRTIRPRLIAAGADMERIHILSLVRENGEDRPPVIPSDLALVEAAVRGHGITLVVIDPLIAYLDGTIDAHRDSDIRRVMHRLKLLAEATGAAVVVVRHLNKLIGGPALYRGGGSIGIVGAVRSALVVGSDPAEPKTRFVLAPTKCNLCRRPSSLAYGLETREEATGEVSKVKWIGESELQADDILTHVGGAKTQGEVERCTDAIRDLLDGKPMKSTELLERLIAAGYSERTVKRAKLAAEVRVTREGFGDEGHWVVSLPAPKGGDEDAF
jgi:hypothetical protein